MTIHGIENGRASFAFTCAKRVKEARDPMPRNEYKTYVRKIPALIRTNGLGATLAFISAKKSNDPTKKGYAYKTIYEQIRDWLEHQKLIKGGDRSLEDEVVGLDSPAYRAVTGEVLSLFRWLSRFAEALIEGEACE